MVVCFAWGKNFLFELRNEAVCLVTLYPLEAGLSRSRCQAARFSVQWLFKRA
ncbi:hypothetical protein J6590_089940, partial [Homalodisca vitripennis]